LDEIKASNKGMLIIIAVGETKHGDKSALFPARNNIDSYFPVKTVKKKYQV